MVIRNIRSPRRLAVMAIFAVVAVSAFGFAAANTGPGTTNAGDGTSDIEGYTVSNVHYTLDGTDPSTIDTVTFNLVPTNATNVQIYLDGAWYTCTPGGSPSCAVGGAADVLTALSLRIVAAQ